MQALVAGGALQAAHSEPSQETVEGDLAEQDRPLLWQGDDGLRAHDVMPQQVHAKALQQSHDADGAQRDGGMTCKGLSGRV